ncbi:hypothetical protein WJX74_003368 [Apatococcus lobatus]|uniref:Chitin-binding type-2 domain-containing protein n=1 Tax=Apatococcus lobatus TaxID=904363 RepID=A0AAW1RJA0_9CHLO
MYASAENPSDFIHCTRGAALTLHCNRDLVWDTNCSCCNIPQSAEDDNSLALESLTLDDEETARLLSDLEPVRSTAPSAPSSLKAPNLQIAVQVGQLSPRAVLYIKTVVQMMQSIFA